MRSYRLPPLTTVFPPDESRVAEMQKRLLTEHGIEVGGGLGPVAGKIWRIGLMGENSRPASVAILLDALAAMLYAANGWPAESRRRHAIRRTWHPSPLEISP